MAFRIQCKKIQSVEEIIDIAVAVYLLSCVQLFVTFGLQHTKLPCPSQTPRVYSNTCPSNRWCHPAISSSVIPFSSCLQSLPESGFFPTSWFFASGGQIIRASASASVLPMNIWGWFPLGLSGFISLLPKGLSRVFSSTTVWRHQFFSPQSFLLSSSHIHIWLLEKP